MRNFYNKEYLEDKRYYLGVINLFDDFTRFSVKIKTPNPRVTIETDPNVVLFFTGILIWSLVGAFWLTHVFCSMCRKIKVLPIHLLLISYFPLRIAHSAVEYVYYLIITESAEEHKNLFYAAYALETLSLSLLIFYFQLISAGYLVIEQRFNICKVRKTLILLAFLIASFWMTLLVNWLGMTAT